MVVLANLDWRSAIKWTECWKIINVADLQRKADLGTKAFEWGGQEVSMRQQESVIAASGGF